MESRVKPVSPSTHTPIGSSTRGPTLTDRRGNQERSPFKRRFVQTLKKKRPNSGHLSVEDPSKTVYGRGRSQRDAVGKHIDLHT